MKTLYCSLALLALGATVACGSNAASPGSDSSPTAVPFGRLDATVGLSANANTLAQDYDVGSTAMYKAIATANPTSNLIFSGYAVQTVMGMMYAGAGGNTATNMATAMHWHLSPADLPAAHAALTTVIATDANTTGTELATGTRLWMDKSLDLKSDYAAGISQNYQATPVVEPFATDAEGSRQTINAWVAQQTRNLIPELLPVHAVDGAVLVQTAAIYFKAAWKASFERDSAPTTPFTKVDGSQTQVTMVRTKDYFQYVNANDYQAIDIPYDGGSLALLVVMPKGTLASFEASLDGAFVHQVVASLTSTQVQLAMPVLDLQQTPDMTAALEAMGLVDGLSTSADFSGISQSKISISKVLEQAVLKLDEHGTEAAAAAAVVAVGSSAPIGGDGPVPLTLDHPFFFAIHDTRAATPLFTGRVVAP